MPLQFDIELIYYKQFISILIYIAISNFTINSLHIHQREVIINESANQYEKADIIQKKNLDSKGCVIYTVRQQSPIIRRNPHDMHFRLRFRFR